MILVQNGQTIPVNDPIMIVAAQDEVVSQAFIESLLHEVLSQPIPFPIQLLRLSTRRRRSRP